MLIRVYRILHGPENTMADFLHVYVCEWMYVYTSMTVYMCVWKYMSVCVHVWEYMSVCVHVYICVFFVALCFLLKLAYLTQSEYNNMQIQSRAGLQGFSVQPAVWTSPDRTLLVELSAFASTACGSPALESQCLSWIPRQPRFILKLRTTAVHETGSALLQSTLLRFILSHLFCFGF